MKSDDDVDERVRRRIEEFYEEPAERGGSMFHISNCGHVSIVVNCRKSESGRCDD